MDQQHIIDDEVRKSLNTPYPITIRWPLHIVNISYAWLFVSLTGRGGPGILEAVNPGMPIEKTAICNSIDPAFHDHLPRYTHYTMDAPDGDHLGAAVKALEEAGLDFPIVAKPELGLQGLLVQRVDDQAALDRYLRHLATHAPGHGVHFQQVVHDPVEFTAFYVREPDQPRGHVTHIVLRQAPCVVGDGIATLEELIRSSGRPAYICENIVTMEAARSDWVVPAGEVVTPGFARNSTHGGMYRDVTERLTSRFSDRVDEIVRSTGYYQYGRLDIRCPSLDGAMHDLQFKILEINGTLSLNSVIHAENVSWWRAFTCSLGMMRRLRRVAIQSARRGGPVTSRRAYFAKLRHIIGLTLEFEKIEKSAIPNQRPPEGQLDDASDHH